ncbi:hypothetical protein F443_18727 [Phytophthora nicotianae P1569]|uniref:Ubiquitin-like protease family profile domain-containing protein n=1 Tax=Phytophthora nicotianae P1569 TaxID=1317065 RepID=V9E713_PHYNI|nr:hypothetical protein F443_18727 [Phytophthora nicotianae P1569]
MVQPLIERPNHIQPAETEEQTLTVDDENHVDFNVMSPPRPRGRPRQKPKAKKAKRNISIRMATEDSEMFEKELNLSTIAETLDVDADYSTMQILRCFKLYHFEKRQKPPTAYELCNIPPGKLLLAPKMLFRVLPIEILSRCQAKVTALQKKRKGLSKVNTAVEIHGVGVFAATTLSLMRNWHKAMESLRLVDKTEKGALDGVSREKILIPLYFNGNHWCAIMIDMTTRSIKYYDPMQSSYSKDVRALAERLAGLRPTTATERARVQPYPTDMGVQVGSYNCGIYMLLAFEMFANPDAPKLPPLSRKMLAYLRYRYLVLCI